MVVLVLIHHSAVDADGEHRTGRRPAQREAERLASELAGVGGLRRGGRDLGEVDGERAKIPIIGGRVEERCPHGEAPQRGAADGEVLQEHLVERGGAPRHPGRRRVLPLLAAPAPPPHHHPAPLRGWGQAGDVLHLQAHHAARAPRAEGAQQPALPLAQRAPSLAATVWRRRRGAPGHVQEVELLCPTM